MKLETKSLAKALSNLKSVIGSRNALQYRSLVHVVSLKGVLSLTATDGDIFVQERIPSSEALDSMCLNFEHLENSIGGESTEIKLDKKHVIATHGKNVTRLSISDASGYPSFPTDKEMKSIGVSCADLSKGIQAVRWAEYKGDAREILEGVHILCEPKRLMCEAANGCEFAQYADPLLCATFEALIPAEATELVAESLLRDGAVLKLSERAILVEHSEGAIWVKQISGKFPDTRKLTDSKYDDLGELEVGPLKVILSRCEHFADPKKSKIAVLTFSGSGISVQFSGLDSEINAQVPGIFKSHTASVNASAFLNCLKSMPEAKCKVSQFDGVRMMLSCGSVSTHSTNMRPT
jgi:DNA polymerase III sliding clamp (beta) subunit (PCNA family)